VFDILGTFDTIDGIYNYFLRELGITSVIRETRTKRIYSITINRKESIFKVLSHLYENTDLYLQRKYDLFEKAFLINKEHLYWQIYCKNLESGEINIFENLQKAKLFFNLKTYGSIAYCINKSKNKIYKGKYYINLLQNE
jgi:hypothetical protein